MVISEAHAFFVKMTTSVEETLRGLVCMSRHGAQKYNSSSLMANAVVSCLMLTKLRAIHGGALTSMVAGR